MPPSPGRAATLPAGFTETQVTSALFQRDRHAVRAGSGRRSHVIRHCVPARGRRRPHGERHVGQRVAMGSKAPPRSPCQTPGSRSEARQAANKICFVEITAQKEAVARASGTASSMQERNVSQNWSRMRLVSLLFVIGVALPSSGHRGHASRRFHRDAGRQGASSPTAMQFAPDGRLFVCEQGGRLRVVKNGALLPTPFLTIP